MESVVEFPANLPMDISNFLRDPSEREWSGPFTFIHAADSQLGLIDKFIRRKDNPGWEEEMHLVTQAIKEINEMNPKPRFFVLGGDMVDANPMGDELEVHRAQYLDFVKLFQHLDPEIKLVCVCGNHDVCDCPTKRTMEIYHEEFGPDFFSFWAGGVKFTVLNSQYFKSPDKVQDAVSHQEDFINTIEDPTAVHSVIFQHYPFFIGCGDEDDIEYLNIEKYVRIPLLERLEKAGVRYVFSGHWHRNGGAVYNDIEQVVTAALGGTYDNVPSGYRIVHVDKDEITHEFICID